MNREVRSNSPNRGPSLYPSIYEIDEVVIPSSSDVFEQTVMRRSPQQLTPSRGCSASSHYSSPLMSSSVPSSYSMQQQEYQRQQQMQQRQQEQYYPSLQRSGGYRRPAPSFDLNKHRSPEPSYDNHYNMSQQNYTRNHHTAPRRPQVSLSVPGCYSVPNSGFKGSHHSVEEKAKEPEPARKVIEVSPGVYMPLHGSAETMEAMGEGALVRCRCLVCDVALYCVDNAEYVLCPTCRVVSPAGDGTPRKFSHPEGPSGVGLGVSEEQFLVWQHERGMI